MALVLRGLRGAITVDEDVREQVIDAARQLTESILQANELVPEDIVSAIYTSTADLSSEFPAVGAREAGLGATPLMCALEIPVPGSQPKCIRVLLHAYMPKARPVRHVYLREAVNLRPDLVSGDNAEVKARGN